MQLQAIECRYHPNDDNGCLTVGFRAADDQYLLLSRSLHPSEQDRRLGLDGVHVELSDQGLSCYDGIAEVSVMPILIRFDLTEKGVRSLRVPFVEVSHDLPPERSHQMRMVLRDIFVGLERFADLG
jgi:Immunity protein 10